MHKEYEKALELLENAKAKREADLEEAYTKYDQAQDIIKNANNDLLTNTVTADTEAYRENKKKIEYAAADIEMYKGRIVLLESEAIINDKECDKFLKSVYAAQEKKKKEFIDNISKVLQDLDKQSADFIEFIEEGNSIIARWGADVKGFKKEIGKKEGKPLYIPASAEYDKATDITNYMQQITHHHQYKKITGKESHNYKKKPIFNV